MNMRTPTKDHLADRVRRLFGSEPCKVQVAALPWRLVEGDVEVMLITSRDTGRWVLPKGWPEKKETLWDAAAREAGEEAGISGAVSSREAGRYYYAKVVSATKDIPCEVQVYPLEVDQVADSWKEERQRKRQWFSPVEAAQAVVEPELGELIRAFGAHPRRNTR